MGDRCLMTVWVAPQDAERFAAQGFHVERDCGDLKRPQPDENGLVMMTHLECDFAGADLDTQDLPWIGEHGAGEGYPAGCVYCLGKGEVQAWPAVADGAFVVRANWEAQVDPAQLEALRRFIAGFRSAEALAKGRAGNWKSEATPAGRVLACEGCDGGGIRDAASPSCKLDIPDGWHVVERCDACGKFENDLAAAFAVYREVRTLPCSHGEHVVARAASRRHKTDERQV